MYSSDANTVLGLTPSGPKGKQKAFKSCSLADKSKVLASCLKRRLMLVTGLSAGDSLASLTRKKESCTSFICQGRDTDSFAHYIQSHTYQFNKQKKGFRKCTLLILPIGSTLGWTRNFCLEAIGYYARQLWIAIVFFVDLQWTCRDQGLGPSI